MRNQRERIGILKAFGYRDVTIAMHYACRLHRQACAPAQSLDIARGAAQR
ncbi:hypothetical protein ACEZHJ_14105 [Arhodomonas sp. KWT2]